MLKRCYDKNWKQKHPTYKDCTVCDEWHNFQNFAQWYEENYYEIPGEIMQLDKDILIKGNKVYSPDTCCFVPGDINSLFIKSDEIRGNLPIGVTKEKDKYMAQCQNTLGYKRRIGLFNTPEEAFDAYKKRKEKIIKEIANKYKEYIPDKLYKAMYNYEVEWED